MKLHLALTQSGLAHNWGSGLTTVNHICRLMSPSATGTTLTFGSNTSLTFDLTMTINASWPVANLELVAFIQDVTSKEVLQTISSPLLTVGVDEQVKKYVDLRIYPNPVSDKCYVETNFDSQNNVVVKINNILGEEVYSNDFGKAAYGNLLEINTSSLPQGMYILNTIVDHQVISKKIIVE